ncbi:MAG: hypothetical protein KDA58_17615, partial [Planctomycetaceae bacterium]|nr:hypothetical protein [Planctomycetaceae bacterium]
PYTYGNSAPVESSYPGYSAPVVSQPSVAHSDPAPVIGSTGCSDCGQSSVVNSGCGGCGAVGAAPCASAGCGDCGSGVAENCGTVSNCGGSCGVALQSGSNSCGGGMQSGCDGGCGAAGFADAGFAGPYAPAPLSPITADGYVRNAGASLAVPPPLGLIQPQATTSGLHQRYPYYSY